MNLQSRLVDRFEMFVVGLIVLWDLGATQYPRVLAGALNHDLAFGNVRVLVTAILYLTLGLLALNRKLLAGVAAGLAASPLLIVILVLASLSIFWSIDPVLSAIQVAILVATSLVGIYVGIRYDLAQLLDILAWTLGVAVVLSIVTSLLLPGISVMTTGMNAGDWRGIFNHKNFMGRALIVAFLVAMTGLLPGRQGSWTRPMGLLLLVLSAVAAVFSNSATANLTIVCLVILALLLPPLVRLRSRPDWAITLTVCVAGLFLLGTLLTHAGQVLQALGKIHGFAARIRLWQALLPYMLGKPWLGYGYDAFWKHFGTTVGLQIHWLAPHPHNGYIQLFLDLGMAGLVCFLPLLIMTARRAVQYYRTNPVQLNLFPLLALFCVVTINLDENRLMSPNDFWWLLFVVVGTLARAGHGTLAQAQSAGASAGGAAAEPAAGAAA